MALRAGRLRQRVTLMRRSRGKDNDGNNVTTWSPVGAPIAAEVIGINGREAIIGRALQGIDSFRITTRYRGDITDSDQLAYQPKGAPEPLTLNIRSATDPDGRREQLQILADTGSAEATA